MKRSFRIAGFTMVEMIVAMAVATIIIVVGFNFFLGGTRESTVMIDKMTAQQETRLAFRRMCDEIRMGRKLVMLENVQPFRMSEYRYPLENQSKQVNYGPSHNYLFFENFDGDIIAYYLFTPPQDADIETEVVSEEDEDTEGPIIRVYRELRRLNVSKRMENPDESSRVVAAGVVADNENPSIFSIAAAYPGKQLSSVLIKLNVRQSPKKPDTNCYSLITSVFLRNMDRLVKFDFDALDDPDIITSVN